MLTDSPTDLAVNFWYINNYMFHHISNASLQYLVKCLCSKIAITKAEWSKLPCKTVPFKTFAQNITEWRYRHLFTGEKIFTMTTQKNSQNDRLYAHPSTKKTDVVTKRLRTQLTFSHWWHQSASHKWLALHQFDTCRSRIQGWRRVLIVTWCCYNSSCPPYIISQASSSSFSRTVPRRTGRSGLLTFPRNFSRCWAILKILSKHSQQ